MIWATFDGYITLDENRISAVDDIYILTPECPTLPTHGRHPWIEHGEPLFEPQDSSP